MEEYSVTFNSFKETYVIKTLGYFRLVRKIAKATISFVMCLSVYLSVRPYVRMEQLSTHWTGFHDIWYLRIFRQSVEKSQVLLKSDTNNMYFTERLTRMQISDNASLNSS